MKINCQHFPSCSGCTRNSDIDKPQSYLEALNFFVEKGISNFKLHTGSACGWRNRAKMAIRGTFEEPLVGLFQAGSHAVVDIPHCKIHHPAINQAAMVLREWIRNHRVTPYDEKSHKGILRYAQFGVELSSGKVQLTLVLNVRNFDHLSEGFKQLLEILWEDNKQLWHSLWLNFNIRKSNVIFDRFWHRYKGEEWLWERLSLEEVKNREICFHPGSFVQGNLEMFQKLLEATRGFIPKKAKVLDLYAGVGAIGLMLVDVCEKVRSVEIVPLAEKCFELSRSRLPSDLKARLSFLTGEASTQSFDSFDTVIVDPPRKGMEASLLQALCQKSTLNSDSSLESLIYISCGWQSFQKDCEALLKAGWVLKAAEGFLFFPGSDHLELLAVFIPSSRFSK